jgi:small-conductance mechanosensitive channel
MNQTQKTILVILTVSLIATTYGLIRTGREANALPVAATTAEHSTLVDQTPFLTAQSLAQMPTVPMELDFAQAALQLGDQELDLAFASALLEATQHPSALSAEAKEIQTRLHDAQGVLAQQQAEVARLIAADAAASSAQKDALDNQLELGKAQLDLAQDEVDDAKQDLIRAGGDPQDRIQAMVQEHESASHVSDMTKVAVSPDVQAHGLLEHFQEWSALRQKQLRLARAKADAASAAIALAAKHDSLEKQFTTQKVQTAATAGDAQAAASSGPGAGAVDTAAALTSTKRGAADRKLMTTLDKRIDAEKQLANVYGQWMNVVASEQRTQINRGLRGVLFILTIVIIGIFLDYSLKRLLVKTSIERRRIGALRTVTRVMMQITGILLVLLVIFGPPTQLGTFLGLAGAGLTVALKDFIISFIGWFVLMNKNGIRLGDWVEINGVTGEVVELGVFHTVLLETGNWTDSGHPTGRRVTFTNSFAVEGHYFNFSTSGQWMWDELQIVSPSGQNPYPVADAIQQKVAEATAESAREAEQEWKRSTGSRDMQALSAAPAVSVKPVVGGTQISVRYITRAHERSQLRAKLNQSAVDVLGAALAHRAG